MVFLLDEDEIGFPDPKKGEEDGFFAVGGDLCTERLLLGYWYGIFPWYAFRAEDTCDSLIAPDGKPYIQWWCPMKRFVIFPNEIHISHSMRQVLNKMVEGEYKVTFNTAFDRIIELCGSTREKQVGAWLGAEMKAAYTRLYEEGVAQSVEVWDKEDNLIGGLFGETIGKAFIGESMVSIKPNASKLALICLAKVMEAMGGAFIDCQLETAHLKSMGGRYIDYDEYLKLMHGEAQENNEQH
ncbi:MAG: leucyl/phenylalanyl-tRNA--protein transferase [Bacteroidales bacterium]|nr:leucyl/phenylalanyl-tRNA--protein transferase [Bacteroidales bacterium]